MAHDLSAANSRAVSVRLPELLYKHLVVQATRADVSIGEAVRQALQRDVMAQPRVPIESNAPGDKGMPYGTLLEGADVNELATQVGRGQGDAEA